MNEITKKNIRYGLTFESKSKVADDSCLLGETCLFCNKPEKNYNPGSDVEFICGTCVQLLLHADQEDLKWTYKKALNLGYPRKASAIETFLITEETVNVSETRKIKRDLARKRPMRRTRSPRHKVRQKSAVV